MQKAGTEPSSLDEIDREDDSYMTEATKKVNVKNDKVRQFMQTKINDRSNKILRHNLYNLTAVHDEEGGDNDLGHDVVAGCECADVKLPLLEDLVAFSFVLADTTRRTEVVEHHHRVGCGLGE